MSGVNKAILLGHVGRDAEYRHTANSGMLTFSLATSERYKDKSGQYVDNTQWHSCVLFGKRADALNGKITKGAQLFVEGQIQYRKTDDGKFYTDIKVLNLEFVSSKGGGSGYDSAGQHGSAPSYSVPSGGGGATGDYGPEGDDDIPF